jgi:hypothetical protein
MGCTSFGYPKSPGQQDEVPMLFGYLYLAIHPALSGWLIRVLASCVAIGLNRWLIEEAA